MESLQSLVPSLVAGLLKQGPLSSAKLELAWRVAVGHALARATEVRFAPPSTLLVTPRDERWRSELQRSRRMILTRLQALVGADRVTRIELAKAKKSEEEPGGCPRSF